MDEISNALKSLKMPGMAHYWTTMQETRQHDSLSLKDGRSVILTALERLVFNECRSVGSNAVAVGFGTSRAAAACQPDHCRACERDKQHLHRLR